MFGIGKILGSVAGGLLEKIGLGKIAPFVKMGLNAMTGNWLGVAKDVFGLVSSFKGDFLDKASQKQPLGGFEESLTQGKPLLDGNRVGGLLKGLSNLFKGLKSLAGGGDLLSGLGKIFSAFNALQESFSNNQMYNSRASASQYSNIRL